MGSALAASSDARNVYRPRPASPVHSPVRTPRADPVHPISLSIQTGARQPLQYSSPVHTPTSPRSPVGLYPYPAPGLARVDSIPLPRRRASVDGLSGPLPLPEPHSPGLRLPDMSHQLPRVSAASSGAGTGTVHHINTMVPAMRGPSTIAVPTSQEEEDAALRMALEESARMQLPTHPPPLPVTGAGAAPAPTPVPATSVSDTKQPVTTQSGPQPIVWNTTAAPSILISRTVGQSRLAGLEARKRLTAANVAVAAPTRAAPTLAPTSSSYVGKTERDEKGLRSGKEERDRKGPEQQQMTPSQLLKRFGPAANPNNFSALSAALLIVSQLDRIGAAGIAAVSSLPNRQPQRVWIGSSDGSRRVYADSSNDMRVRVLADPLAPAQPDEIFECRWISDKKFHLVYKSTLARCDRSMLSALSPLINA